VHICLPGFQLHLCSSLSDSELAGHGEEGGLFIKK